jgi:large subunit ribosomal protein L4
MIEIPVYNQAGQEVSKVQVDEAKLGGAIRPALLKQALVMYHANKRQGTVKTLARGEVEGSTRKIYRQKGTGNARMGPIRQPVRVGGGHAKQKRPKDWRQAMPKKMRRLARDSAILSKLQSNEIRVLEDIKLNSEKPKTKEMAAIFRALGLDRSVLLALPGHDAIVERCARNVDRIRLTTVAQLNAWDIMNTRVLLTTKAGLDQIFASSQE